MIQIIFRILVSAFLAFLAVSFAKFFKDYFLEGTQKYLTDDSIKTDYSEVIIYILSLAMGVTVSLIANMPIISWIGLAISWLLWKYLSAAIYIWLWVYIIKHKQKNTKLMTYYAAVWAIDASFAVLIRNKAFGFMNEAAYKVFKIYNLPFLLLYDYSSFMNQLEDHWFNCMLLMVFMSAFCIRYLIKNIKNKKSE